MKTKISIWIFLALFTQSLTGSTGIPEFIIINNTSKSGISVEKNKWNAGQVDFKIIKDSGEVLFSDQMSNNEIGRKKFITAGMEDGSYVVEWQDQLTVITQELEIDDSMPVLKSHSYEVLFKPVLKVNENILDISVLTLGKSLTCKLFDPKGNLILKESIVGQESYQRRFNIQNVLEGEYVLLTDYKGKTVRQYVRMKN